MEFENSPVVSQLHNLIEKAESCSIEDHRGIREIWFRGDNGETELRLLSLMGRRITLSRVCFVNRRQGTMTKVKELLEAYCIENHVPKLVIQSVETKEMSAWCFKNGFQPDPYTTFDFNGFIAGDFIKTFTGGGNP